MRRYFLVLVLFSFLFSVPTYSAEKMIIAVLDLQPKGVSRIIANAVSDILRSEMIKTGMFTVLERAQMNEIMKEQGLQMTGCTDSACAVKVGKLLSAKKMLMGEINRVGKAYIITVRIVDVEKGVSEFAANEKALSEDVLDKASVNITRKLAANIIEGHEELFITKKSAMGYYMRSIVPGWGQFYVDRPVKGLVFSGVFVLSVAFAYYAYTDYQDKDDAYHELSLGSSEFDKKYDEYEKAGNLYNYSVGLVLLVYALHWADVLFLTKPDFVGESAGNSGTGTFIYVSMNRGPKILPERRIGITAGFRF